MAAGLFALLRQLERWLHQHIFKVGWLVTKSFQTTTILYYTFFLPGVVLHELSYWFAAGVLNVHAKGSIKWPEAQEIAELDLSFVELAKNVSPFRLGIITLAPILAGLGAVWIIANNILQFNNFFATLSTGDLADVTSAIRGLTSAADFWLWIYILFTISNTMLPKLQNLCGLRVILTAIGIVAVILIFIGVGNEVVLAALVGPVTDALYLLSGAFTVIILIDLMFVAILGTVEAFIERVTGDSAMFRRGKLVAMTRQEILEMRQRQNRRDARALQARTGAKESILPASIYSRPLLIPGPPGEEPVTHTDTVIVERDEKPALAQGARPDPRRGPEIISGAATSRPVSNEVAPSRALPALSTEATPADAGLAEALDDKAAPAQADHQATSAEPEMPEEDDEEPVPQEETEDD